MVQVHIEAKVPGLGNVLYCVDAPFDQALSAIESKGGTIIAAKQLADARMQFDTNHSLSTNGSYVLEQGLWVPKGEHRRIIVHTPKSFVLANPSLAVKAHRQGHEYFVQGSVQDVLSGLKEGKDYIFLKCLKAVPTNRFGEDGRMVFLFGKSAEDYGLWLKEKGNIYETGFYSFRDNSYIDKQSGLFADQLWLHGLGIDSYIGGICRNLLNNNKVRGVQSNKSIEDTYTTKQISQALRAFEKKSGINGLESQVMKTLRK